MRNVWMVTRCNILLTRIIRNQINYIPRRPRTIFALSSGQNRAAIAVIRVSGPKASSVLEAMTRWTKKESHPGLLFFTQILHPINRELLDKAMAVWMPGPRTFTGEDCCELHVHGGPSVVGDVLHALSYVGDCFPAEPGEFTKRAFYNGKLDLTGVEGLGDLLRAETSAQRKLALRQAGGELKRLYSDWRQRLLKCVAHVEAFVDFSEDAHIEEDVLLKARRDVEVLLAEMTRHLSNGRVGERLRDGVRVAIVGEPNVGKSSLLNRICKRPAAIVTPIAGTTRDPLDIALNLNGYPVLLTDTAGLRYTEDIVEKEGVRRASQKLREADILLIVMDASKLCMDTGLLEQEMKSVVEDVLSTAHRHNSDGESQDAENVLVERYTAPEIIYVLNKVDLIKSGDAQSHFVASGRSEVTQKAIPTSCVTVDGLNDLINTLAIAVEKMCTLPDSIETIPLTQERHRFLVNQAIMAIKSCLEECENGDRSLVFGAEYLREAMHALGKITGEEITTDAMLDVLFRDFCIGK